MKKFIAISFLFIYLTSTTELHQLLKTPLLVEHLVTHRNENRSLTLWQFLYIHYAMGDVMDADYDKDLQLPFKSHDSCVSAVSSFYVSLTESFLIQPIKQIVEENILGMKDGFLLTSFLSNIWQPPRA